MEYWPVPCSHHICSSKTVVSLDKTVFCPAIGEPEVFKPCNDTVLKWLDTLLTNSDPALDYKIMT